MNQTRNLIFNIIFNTIFTIGGFYILVNFRVDYNDAPWISKVAFDVFALGMVGVVLYIIDKVITHPEDISIMPPYGFFFLLYFLFKMLIGDVKKVRSVHASYYVRVSGEKLFVYNFSVIKYARVWEMGFNGNKHQLIYLKEQFEKLAKVSNEFSFRTWDGSLDQESKRINTIDKIIK